MSGENSRALSAEAFRRLNDILLAALEKPAAARSAYLDRACGNDGALRQEVESLLEVDSGVLGSVDRPLVRLLRNI